MARTPTRPPTTEERAAIERLANRLKDRPSDFGSKLLATFTRYGRLSEKRWEWVVKLADEKPRPTVEVPAARIVELLTGARESGLKYPKIRLATDDGTPVVFALAGKRSKAPGTVTVTDGGPYGANRYFGRIRLDGNMTVAPKATTAVVELVKAFADNPAAVAGTYGRANERCCFCATRIDTNESKAVGYGPVCAERYGLPWGGTAEEMGAITGLPPVKVEEPAIAEPEEHAMVNAEIAAGERIEPEPGTYAFTARMMAEACPVDGDPDFWDRWKDEMKEGSL